MTHNGHFKDKGQSRYSGKKIIEKKFINALNHVLFKSILKSSGLGIKS